MRPSTISAPSVLRRSRARLGLRWFGCYHRTPRCCPANFRSGTRGPPGREQVRGRIRNGRAAPYLPAKLLYSMPLSAAALDEHGPLYNTNPDTHVSSGPFKLEEWARDQHIIYTRNEAYTGDLQVPLQKIIVKMAAPNATFTLYEADQIDYMQDPPPPSSDHGSDPETAEQVYQGVGDFACLCCCFDVTAGTRQTGTAGVQSRDRRRRCGSRSGGDRPDSAVVLLPASSNTEAGRHPRFDPGWAAAARDAGCLTGFDLILTYRGGGTAQTRPSRPMRDAQSTSASTSKSDDGPAGISTTEVDPVRLGLLRHGLLRPSNMLGVWTTEPSPVEQQNYDNSSTRRRPSGRRRRRIAMFGSRASSLGSRRSGRIVSPIQLVSHT